MLNITTQIPATASRKANCNGTNQKKKRPTCNSVTKIREFDDSRNILSLETAFL